VPPSLGTSIARALAMHAMRSLRVGLFLFVLTLLTLARPGRSRAAESAPSLPGFSTLGQVSVDKTGCPSCPAVITTDKRHRTFALASDSPFPVVLSGRVDVKCADGASYHVFLHSPHRGGPFQVVANSCVNLDSKEITLTVTSVGLAPADAERTVALIAYGSFG
jgi:hypothetical protein